MLNKRQLLRDYAKWSNSLKLASAGGGGYPPPPAPPDYEAQSRAQIEQQNNQARLDAEAAARDKAAKDAADALAESQFQSKLQSSYNQAGDYGRSRLAALGIQDNYGILDAYNNEINRAKTAIPDKDPNPGNYFTPSMFDNALNQQRTTQRNKLQQQYASIAPDNFESSLIPDTMDDQILNSIINEQYGNADAYLKRASDRGQLTPDAFSYAEQQLGNSRSGALAKATDLGKSVLADERTNLTNLAKQGQNSITNWDFGSTFDPTSYGNKFTGEVNSFKPLMEGRIRNTIGDTQFFDPQSLITKAGSFVGPQNGSTAANPLLSAIGANVAGSGGSTDNKKTTSGSQGVF